MKPALPLILAASLTTSGLAGFHDFTDAKGRSLTAEIMTVRDDTVTIKRKDGKIFTLPNTTFSEEDQSYIREWEKENKAKLAELNAAAEIVKKRTLIAEYCVSKKGQKVGNGECWTLADNAYKACKAKRPKGKLRVWGRLVDLETEKIEPGDVVEFRKAKVPGYGTTGPVHTAVAIESGRKKRCTIAEQNIGGVKKVMFTELDLRRIDSGEVMVYRLEQ